VLVVEQVTVIGAAERLAEPGRGIRADSQELVSQAGLAQVPYPVQALADSDSHCRRLCLAGQCGEFLDQLVSLGILDVEAHVPPFYPALATRVPFRLSRTDPGTIENLGGWLTTVVARVCLTMLQARREQPVGVHLPESVVSDADGIDPETEALLVDSIGPALLVLLHTLTPAERLAFILHDIFAVPFDDIAAIIGRPPGSARRPLAAQPVVPCHGVRMQYTQTWHAKP
jgi:hypothetical protein